MYVVILDWQNLIGFVFGVGIGALQTSSRGNFVANGGSVGTKVIRILG